MAGVFEKPKALTDAVLHYCPGCPHGIIPRPDQVLESIRKAQKGE